MNFGKRLATDLRRASPELLQRFYGVATGNVVDAYDRISAMHYSIKPVTKSAAIVGSALTVRAWPGDNLIVNKAIEMALPGDVIVIDNGGFEGCSVWGDLTSWMAINAGVVGVVTNGLVRDIAGLDEAGLPVFAHGVVPSSGFKRGPGEIGFPVSCGGLNVKSGDIVVTDIDGVVVIPLELADETADAIPDVLENERLAMEHIRSGQKSPKNFKSMLKGAGY